MSVPLNLIPSALHLFLFPIYVDNREAREWNQIGAGHECGNGRRQELSASAGRSGQCHRNDQIQDVTQRDHANQGETAIWATAASLANTKAARKLERGEFRIEPHRAIATCQ